eukprot:48479_1
MSVFIMLSMIMTIVFGDAQLRVECSGTHALCLFALCDISGECHCKMFDGIFQVATNAIGDVDVKANTQSACTSASPCGLNEAPVCDAILNVESGITSAFSWNEFCERSWPLEQWTDCLEDDFYASCMMAPCVPNMDPDGFATCYCAVNQGSYIENEVRRSCQYRANAIKASVPAGFDFGFFDGMDYVYQACQTWRI